MSVLGTVVRTGVGATLRGVEFGRRATDVALALPRIALALERLGDATPDLHKLAEASDDVRRLLNALAKEDIDVARDTLERLADAVGSLNGVVASLNSTISPLQGATERLGRFVDRIPARGRGRVLDVPAGTEA
jgi:ABC-type transporter Mla subunit MlaD